MNHIVKYVLLFTCIYLGIINVSFSQLSNYHFNKKTTIRLFNYQGVVTNNWPQKSTKDRAVSHWKIHLGFAKSNFGSGSIQRSHRLPTLGDAALSALISPIIDGGISLTIREGDPISTSFTGWQNS